MKNILLKTEELSKLYNSEYALKNINISVYKNDRIALIGPNGAGKSTFIKLLLNLDTPDSGNIIKYFNAKISYAPEESSLYPDIPVAYFLNWIKKVKNINQNRLNEFIKLFELNNVLTKKIKILSKGYRRRILLLYALIGNENFIILDEPSDGLDIEFKFKLRDILKQKIKNKTLLICSHESVILNEVVNRIIILNRGEKIFDDSISKLKNKNKRLYIEDIYERFKNK